MLKLVAVLGAVAVAAIAWALFQDRTPKLGPNQIRGAWLAAAGKASLESEAGLAAMKKLKELGVDTLAVFPEVTMPDITKPGFTWGTHDGELRAFLKAAKSLGMSAFVLPRIESPAFFVPPHPWRARSIPAPHPRPAPARLAAYRRTSRHRR